MLTIQQCFSKTLIILATVFQLGIFKSKTMSENKLSIKSYLGGLSIPLED